MSKSIKNSNKQSNIISNDNKILINNKTFVFNNHQKLVINNLGEYRIIDYNTGKKLVLKSGSIYSYINEELPISSAFLVPVRNSISTFKKDHYRKSTKRLLKSNPDYLFIRKAEFLILNLNYTVEWIWQYDTELDYKLDSDKLTCIISSDRGFEFINPTDNLQLIINEDFVIYCRINKKITDSTWNTDKDMVFNGDKLVEIETTPKLEIIDWEYELIVEKVYNKGRFIYKSR